MTGLVAGLWGLFGAFATIGLDYNASWQRYRCWPWQVPLARDSSEQASGAIPPLVQAGKGAYLVIVMFHLATAAGVAWATAAGHLISGSLSAVGLGAAAPTIIRQLAQNAALIKLPALPTPAASTQGQPVRQHVAHTQVPAPSETTVSVLEGAES